MALGLALVLFTDGGANRTGTATVASVSSPAGNTSSSTSAVKAVTSSSSSSATSVYNASHTGVVSILSTSNNDSTGGGGGGRGFGGGGSGSSQSTALGSGILLDTKGDILTNEHVVSSCVEDLSTPERNYVATGFTPASRAEEQACPGMVVEILTDIARLVRQLRCRVADAA